MCGKAPTFPGDVLIFTGLQPKYLGHLGHSPNLGGDLLRKGKSLSAHLAAKPRRDTWKVGTFRTSGGKAARRYLESRDFPHIWRQSREEILGKSGLSAHLAAKPRGDTWKGKAFFRTHLAQSREQILATTKSDAVRRFLDGERRVKRGRSPTGRRVRPPSTATASRQRPALTGSRPLLSGRQLERPSSRVH
jgi:hypothetical protein